MTRRLLVSYATFALVVLLGLEVPLAVLGARRYRTVAIGQTEKVATALAVAANADFEAGRTAALRALVARYREQTGGEVEVVDRQGRVLANADPDGDDDAGTTDRSFVHTALTGAVAGGTATDEGDTVYVAAAPIGDPTGPGAMAAGAVDVSVSDDPTEDRIHLFWAGLAGLAVIVLVAALLLGWWLARTVTRPLARLGLAVQALGQPDLGVRADEGHGPPEVVALAHQFNLMAGQLRELIDAQNRFVADASHQLRSPLAALRLRIENLQVDADPAQATTVRATTIEAATVRALDTELQRLSRLVDGLINLGNAETTTPTPVPIGLDQVLRERVEVWSALASERDVTLDLGGTDLAGVALSGMALTGADHGEPWEARLGDGDLDQVVDNLLANALDVSPAGGRITITLLPAPPGSSGVVITIADEGPGMTDEQLDRAFDRFWRGPDRQSAAGGLGLAIVRQLVVRNGLAVDLARRPAGGIAATITVPDARLSRRGR